MRLFKKTEPVTGVRHRGTSSTVDYARGIFDGVDAARKEIVDWLEACESATIDCEQLITAIRSHDPSRLKE